MPSCTNRAVDLTSKSRREIGALGERIAAQYAVHHGMRVVDRNVTRKTGELDLIGQDGDTLHFIEVKTMLVDELPVARSTTDEYDPSLNLHEAKVRKVARTAEWYVAEHGWEGEWQVDGCLIWLRRRDGKAFVRYLPQIV